MLLADKFRLRNSLATTMTVTSIRMRVMRVIHLHRFVCISEVYVYVGRERRKGRQGREEVGREAGRVGERGRREGGREKEKEEA